MTRAAQACAHAGCGNLQPCDEHQRKPWQDSTRSHHPQLRGSRAAKRRRFVLNKYDTICHVCGRPGAEQVDHVRPLSEGGPDAIENLRPIHDRPCHRDKTAAEAKRGRERAQ